MTKLQPNMTPLPFGLLALILYWFISPVAANGAEIFVTTSLENFDARIVQGWSGGGGGRWNIGNDSNHPFVGREFGSAGRGTLKGTQVFGSGYPYGVTNNSTIAGRPFPYGLWPIYWGNNTIGSAEYGPALDSLRPGGELVTIPLTTQKQYYNVTDGEIYHIIGDRDSALFMMISLVTSCHATPAWPSKFNPKSPNSTIKIENAIQYYRASSFALVYPGYNNTLALRNNNTESTESMPLPDIVLYSQFRNCIDDVIMDALAIMNEPPHEDILGDTLGWVFGLFAIPTLGGVLWCIFLLIIGCLKGTMTTVSTTLLRKRAALDARKTLLAYENYP